MYWNISHVTYHYTKLLGGECSANLIGQWEQTRNPCLVWKDREQVYKTDEEICDLPDDQVQIAYSSDGVYKLTMNNTKIGVAIDLDAIFGVNNSGFTGILFEDPNYGCFAFLVWSPDEVETLQIDNREKLILPLSSCLYDNVYRSFHNNGGSIDNPYYGPNGETNFDFTRLPDLIFLRILRHLPLAQRVHARRVSQRWLSMANTALAMDMKNISTSQPFYSKMAIDQFQSFLPLVSECLEELTLSDRLVPLYTFSNVASLPALKKLYFDWSSMSDSAALFHVLDKCPILNVLRTPIPTEFPMPYDTHGPYSQSVEDLTLWGKHVSDPRLVAFLECFPNLTHLSVSYEGYLTASCISWVTEKYGSKLQQLKLPTFNNYDVFSTSFGDVTGIQACSNLKYLLLHDTNVVSDVLMGALTAGCQKMETLSLKCDGKVTDGGVAALAMLPNLTRLKILGGPNLSVGVTAIARQGRLIEFVVCYVPLSAVCLKTIIRHCRHLKRLEVSRNRAVLTMEDATEIIRLYGVRSMEPRLVFHADDEIWDNGNVREVIDEIRENQQKNFDARVGNFF